MNHITKNISLALALLLSGATLMAQDYGTSAVSTATGDDLYKIANSDFSNTFVGEFAGMTVMQGSGENSAQWLIRGMGSYGVGSWSTAKIFVDGFEVNKEYLISLSAAEIEKVEVLKDAAALAIYGERGANGVIRITTRRGIIGKPKVTARVRYGVQTPSSLNKPMESLEFAQLYNQAVSNDNGMVWTPYYSESMLAAYRDGSGVNVDWYGQAMRKVGSFGDADVIINGGSEAARYSISLDYLGNSGLLNTRNTDATKNLGYDRFNVRANLDFKVLKIFEVRFDMGGRIELQRRPNYEINSLFNDLARYPSNIYNVYDNEEEGNFSGTAVYPNNPYASVNALGWAQRKSRSLQTNIAVKERLDAITNGLYLEEAVSFYNYTISTYNKTRNYARWFEGNTTTTDQTTTLVASGYGSGGMQDWKQGRVTLGYERDFDVHHVSASLNFGVSAYKGDGYFSYKYNTANIFGVFHYDYKHKLIAELAFSEYGNDAYAPGHRWAFYPTASLAYMVTDEIKLRASAGLSGSSDSGATSATSSYSSNGRYLFKNYYTTSYIGSFYTGATSGSWQNTLVPMFISNEDAHAEKSLKLNIGTDMNFKNGLSLTADAFLDRRSDILTLDSSLLSYYGKQFYFSNIGKMTSYGFELEAGYQGHSGDFGYRVNGNVSYSHNIVNYMAEVPTANSFSAATGRPYGTYIGLVADGFYDVTDFDDAGNLVEGLPTPAFGSVQPGDVKYLDLDKNGIVDQNDVTKIGRSWVPEWNFALGAKLSYKGFDLSLMFQGVAGVSCNILDNWNQTVAFVDNGNAYSIAKGAWAYYPTEGIDNRANATYPRLTTQGNENNYRTSSLWIKDASFIKLRNLELGYNFCSKGLGKAGIQNFRCFVNGQNLFAVSPLLMKYNLDPENLSGLYPLLRTFNAGVSVTF